MTESLFGQVGGAPRLLALAHRWHELCLADPVAAHPFEHPDLHPEHTQRLAVYLGEALGGPNVYTQSMGDETQVRRLHAGNGRHDELDERANSLFDQALIDVGVPEDLRSSLREYFRFMTAQLAAYPDSPDQVPDGLALPRWPLA